MSKPSTQPTTSLEERKAQSNHDQRGEQTGDAMPKPLSGSKKVKNQNHSRQNHGEGS